MKLILASSLFFPLFGLFFGVGIKATGRNEKPKGELESYEYSYSTMARFPHQYYQVQRDSAGMLCIYYSRNCEEEISVIQAPGDALEHIAGIARECRMHKLRSSYRPRMEVLDGYGWHCFLSYSEGYISSGGSNAGAQGKPGAGIYAINDYIQALIEASRPEDVIRMESHLDNNRR
jgi:hypothetical protein